VTGNGTVSCGGKTYKTVKIGNQTWMAENLNYAVEGSKCYGEGGEVYEDRKGSITLSNAQIQANCAKYGRLYDWSAAMGIDAKYNSQMWNGSDVNHRGICPSGWHLPSEDEWKALVSSVGGSSTAGKHLKTKEGWNSCGPTGSDKDYLCEDTYGFSALPGGGCKYGVYFSNVGDSGDWWSASEFSEIRSDDGYIMNIYAYIMNMYYASENVFGGGGDKSLLFSVRCLQD
jgi:uncharacterized protein (TIGR02145 family)